MAESKRSKRMQEQARAAARGCMGFAVRRTGRAITQAYDRALAPAGITGAQFSVLNALFLLQQPSMGRLAEVLATDRTTLTRNLKLLQQQGMVEHVGGEDRRARYVRLTSAGRQTLGRALDHWQALNERLYESFGQQEAGELLAELARLSDLLREE